MTPRIRSGAAAANAQPEESSNAGELEQWLVAASSAEEAKASMGQDPAVQAGFFDHEIHPVMLPSLDSLRIRD